LNRPTSKSYNDSNPQTPTVNYFYDAQSLPSGAPSFTRGSATGHLVAVTYGGGSAGDYFGYDGLGRNGLKIQQTGGINYQTSAVFNRASAPTSETYPSIRTVSYAYDQAGRTTSVTGYLGDGTSRTYSTSITYSDWGSLSQEQFGTDTAVYNKLFYNSRGQLSEIRESTTGGDTSWNRGAIINQYSNNCWGMCGGSNSSTSMTDNNGNLKRQDMYIPDNDQISSYKSWVDNYSYDNFNRLTQVSEDTGNSSYNWQQSYTMDRWGNRKIDYNNTSSGLPRPQFDVDPNTNRLTVPSGQSGAMTYDNAGNLTTDSYTGQGDRKYDAENRMTQAWSNSRWQTYTYDGSGQRVRRNVNGVETWQVYGLGGELVAEYVPSAPATIPDKEYGYRNGQLLVTASAVDLALGKTATQSSTFYIMTANLAVDGNTNGDFWGGMTSATADYGYQDWWQVDLGSSQSIGSIQVWPRTDCCPEHTANFYVLVSDNVFTSTDLNTTLNQAGVSAYYTSGNGGTPTTVNVNRSGRYVRVQRSDSQYLVLAEVKVLASTADLRWMVTDQLGTPRMIFDKMGSLSAMTRHDYLPFGEEVYASTGLRTTTQGYTAPGYTATDKARQKFIEQERDAETGMDYMHARYFVSTQGRFTSVDPLGASANAGNPQSWNRYSYALNNPLRYNDPSGLETSGYQSGDMNGPGVGNPQDSPDEQRHRMQQFLALEEANEAEAARLEAVRNGEAVPPNLTVSTTDESAENGGTNPQNPAPTPQQPTGNTSHATAEAAGVAAIITYNPTSIQQNLEYAGEVCQQQNGTFIFTLGPANARTANSSDSGVCPPGTTEAADWHTHAAHDPTLVSGGFFGIGRKDYNEKFSPGDKRDNNIKGVPGYLGTPQGKIKVFIPGTPGRSTTTGKVRTLY
jgi:RHS repeat-associated protein